MSNDIFYTMTAISDKNDEILLTRIGANDPEFNLRRDPGFIIRRKNVKETIFVSIIEPHGSYSPISEFAVNAYSNIEKLSVALNDEKYTAVEIVFKNGTTKLVFISNQNNDKNTNHQVIINNKEYQWIGSYVLLNK